MVRGRSRRLESEEGVIREQGKELPSDELSYSQTWKTYTKENEIGGPCSALCDN
jgi:hypothetical protein